ncbi:hypothetical protein [Saccharopolyspora phatthalungensis]|uniref:Putative membrane protein n=1 Tax=Saccharopolyspora phatthalungensis TaxID=664693 RepID=A0A840QCR9_9PSEU|nr:hypothetical protein [Saccharopolyspora phatthalungensis]MBB5156245.1 putative membrane protein [Saccharopolyspora phatthalungensis]
MIWIQLAAATLCGGLSLHWLRRQDRSWRGFGHFFGLVSTAATVAVVAFFATYAAVGVLLGLLWALAATAP